LIAIVQVVLKQAWLTVVDGYRPRRELILTQPVTVLGRSESVSWFTAGGDLGQYLTSEHSSILLFINRTCRAVISDNVQSSRVFEEELAGLGFQLKERPWYDDPTQVVAELGHHKKVAVDSPFGPWPNEMERLRPLRLSLTKLERQWMRELGRTLTLAVEATCRNFQKGESEADLAGYTARQRDPLCTDWNARRVCGMGPPSSGFIAIAQILGITSIATERLHTPAPVDGKLTPEFLHIYSEASRLAFADRNLANAVAHHKSMFFAEKAVDGAAIADHGAIRLRAGEELAVGEADRARFAGAAQRPPGRLAAARGPGRRPRRQAGANHA